MKSLYTILSAGLLMGGILSRAQAIKLSPVEFDEHVSDDNSPTTSICFASSAPA
jgi:hypothetical protein